MHVSQAPLDPVVIKTQALVVEAQDVKDSSIEVVDRDLVLNRLVTELISRSITERGLNA